MFIAKKWIDLCWIGHKVSKINGLVRLIQFRRNAIHTNKYKFIVKIGIIKIRIVDKYSKLKTNRMVGQVQSHLG